MNGVWTLAPEEVFQALGSGPEGLGGDDVARRRSEVGSNRLPEARRRSRLALFAAQFKSLLILLLIGAAVLALLVGDWLWAALSGVLLLQVGVVHAPFLQSDFDTTGLSLGDWALAAAIAASILVLDELRKLGLRATTSRSLAD